MEHLLHELPDDHVPRTRPVDVESSNTISANMDERHGEAAHDRTPLLQRNSTSLSACSTSDSEVTSHSAIYGIDSNLSGAPKFRDPTKPLAGLNALEIAAVANAKKFLGQRLVQKVVEDIWDGNIIFWETMSVNAVKKARVYNKR